MSRHTSHKKKKPQNKSINKQTHFVFIVNGVVMGVVILLGVYYLFSYTSLVPPAYNPIIISINMAAKSRALVPPQLNKVAYNARMLALAHKTFTTTVPNIVSITATATPPLIINVSSTTANLWPIKTVYPNYGAILPFNRIVAYYGNFYSPQMGILGEYPPQEVLIKLKKAVAAWQAADPTTPVIPAIDYIAVTAQDKAGKDGKYRLRMPASQIEKAIQMANEAGGLVFLDVQVGLSTLPQELPPLKRFLKMPQVELAIDPEFSMTKSSMPPGTVIGTFDADNINYAANYLAGLVRKYHIPPKILVIHRFTYDMVTNYQKITPLPQVQIVIDMDGWGSPARKERTYRDVISRQPVQFTGIKLFYKNDIRPPSTRLLTPVEILELTPSPIFIQYQ